jgi:hypothetical protein
LIDFTIPQEGYISNDFILRTSNELGEFVKSILFVLVTAGALCCHAQQPATDPAMSRFFGGNWSCAGEFASGKKIEADVSFAPELDGKWLLYRHTDRPPGPFKAMALWGVDQPSGNLISVMEDNFGNARLFTSDGWTDGSVTFTRAAILDQKISQERFRYERQSADSFKMTYERSVDNHWKMADSIVCMRK